MAIGDALTAPTGVQNQMVGQPSRVPGYDQGYAQAPGMPRPTQPNPMGRPTAVVGGPAYFTPEGYNAPPQPTQAFMPTDRAPDPIGEQFMRQMQSPMGQQYQQQYEATQAPIREAEMAQRAEQQAAQDARFQEMMDRIAELEGQLSQPTEPTPPTTPMPGDDSFINLPDFLGNLDFSGLPANLGNLDFGQIIKKYQDRMNSGEPEPINTFIEEAVSNQEPDLGYAYAGGTPDFDMTRELTNDPNYIPPRGDAGAMPPENNFFVDGDGNLTVGDGIIRTMPVGDPVPFDEPIFTNMRENMPPPVRFKMPELPDFQSPVVPTPAPTPAPVMPTAPINIPNIPNIPNIDFSNLDFSGLPQYQMPAPAPAPAPAPVMPEPNSFFPGVIPDFSNIDFSKINIPDFQSPVMPTPAPAPQAPMPMPVPNYIPNIPSMDFSNLPKAGGMPSMDFSNLRNFSRR
jgi:hypothetical protein